MAGPVPVGILRASAAPCGTGKKWDSTRSTCWLFHPPLPPTIFTPRDHHSHPGSGRSVMTGSTKYIFVTGGVTSSLGKGIISASLAKLLQARGFTVTIQKLTRTSTSIPVR